MIEGTVSEQGIPFVELEAFGRRFVAIIDTGVDSRHCNSAISAGFEEARSVAVLAAVEVYSGRRTLLLPVGTAIFSAVIAVSSGRPSGRKS